MIEADGVDHIEAGEIVFVWRVIPVPRYDVQRRMIDLRGPQPPEEFGNDPEIALGIFECRDRREEIARIRQAIGADGAEVRQSKRQAMVLADIAAREALGQIDAELDAARDHRDLA